MELVLNEPVCQVGLGGKDLNALHAGHTHICNEVKRLRPDVKIIGKVFYDRATMFNFGHYFHAIIDPDTGIPVQHHGNVTVKDPETYDKQAMKDWAEANTVMDYLVVFEPQTDPWKKADPVRIGVATNAPCYNLKKHFSELSMPVQYYVDQANQIMIDEELFDWPHIMHVNQIRYTLIALLMNVPNYKVKCSGMSEPWLCLAKKYIYDNYASDFDEYLTIDPYMDTDTDMPMASSWKDRLTSEDKTKVKAEVKKFKEKKVEPTVIYSPQWLDGKVIKRYDYVTPSDLIVPIFEVE